MFRPAPRATLAEISGKAVTPFLLSGPSGQRTVNLETTIALVRNDARLAAQTAALSQMA